MERNQIGYVGDSAVMPNFKAPPTFEVGRTCAQEGCGTQLSCYNSHNLCSLHVGAVYAY